MRNTFKTIAIVIAILTVYACNKSKTYSNHLMKAGMWKVTELSVDGVNEAELPTWEIEDCDIYKESCMGEWKNEEGGHAEFVWQFRNKGKIFELSRQEGEHSHGGHADEEAAEQAYHFSGVYDVIEHHKDRMEFTTNSAVGFPGQKVVIKITK